MHYHTLQPIIAANFLKFDEIIKSDRTTKSACGDRLFRILRDEFGDKEAFVLMNKFKSNVKLVNLYDYYKRKVSSATHKITSNIDRIITNKASLRRSPYLFDNIKDDEYDTTNPFLEKFRQMNISDFLDLVDNMNTLMFSDIDDTLWLIKSPTSNDYTPMISALSRVCK